MADVDRQTRDALGNVSGPMMPPRAEYASLPKERKLALEDVPGLERPLKAGPNDVVVGEDELGNLIYYNPTTNFKYTIELNPDQRTSRQKFTEDLLPAVQDYLSDPSLPSGQQALDFGKGVVKGAYDSLEGAISGEGTYGDLLDTAGMAATGSLGFKVPEDATRIFGGKAANKADFSAYQTAKRLLSQKEKPQDVWEKTGWARNRKGELRFEIDDDEFQYFGVPTSQEYYYLDSVVQHPQLFENYPKLKDTLISEQLLEDEHLGYVDFTSDDPPRAFIVVNSNSPKGEKLDTILHELQHLVQSIEDPDFARKYEFNRTYFGYSNQPEEVEAELPGKRRILPKEVRKKELPKFNKGGLTMDKQMNKLFAEGGINTGKTTVDPVSGNEVPPGSLPSEVRDDVDAKLSGGEYVVPADVLRYYGVAFFEKLRTKAKAGLGEMDADGRIGGGTAPEEDFPFSVDELEAEDDMNFAEGGAVPDTVPKATGFNFDDWSYGAGGSMGQNTSGTQIKKYKDKSGNVVQVLFIDGKPVVDVNALGYTEYTEETPVATGEEVQSPKDMILNKDSSDKDPPPNTKTGDPSARAKGWAEKNYDAIEADPLSFGMNALKDTTGDTTAKIAGGLGILSGIPVLSALGGALKGGNKVQNIAEASVASLKAKAQGLDTTELDKLIADAVEKLPGGLKFAVENDLAGTGNNYAKALDDLAKTRGDTTITPASSGLITKPSGTPTTKSTTPVTKTTPTSNTSSSSKDSWTPISGGSGSVGTSQGVTSVRTGITSDGGYATSKTVGSSAPTSSSRPQARPTSSQPAVNQNAYNAATSTDNRKSAPMAKGGLVDKPKKVVAPKPKRKTKI